MRDLGKRIVERDRVPALLLFKPMLVLLHITKIHCIYYTEITKVRSRFNEKVATLIQTSYDTHYSSGKRDAMRKFVTNAKSICGLIASGAGHPTWAGRNG